MKKGDTTMEKKYSGAPGMTAPAYTGSSMPGGCGAGKVMPAYGMGGYPTGGYPTGGYPSYPSQVGPAQMGPSMVAPTQTLPPVVHPTQNVINKNIMKHVVPHVHPTHTTTVNEHVFQHQHHFPQTQSVVNKCCNQQVICGPIPRPHHGWNCPPRPYC